MADDDTSGKSADDMTEEELQQALQARLTEPVGWLIPEDEYLPAPEDYELFDQLGLLYPDQKTPEYKARVYAQKQ